MMKRRSFLATLAVLAISPLCIIPIKSKKKTPHNCDLPTGISNATGNYSFSDKFATLTVAVTVQYGFPMSIGECFFLRMAIKKFNELQDDGKNPVTKSSPAKEIMWTRTVIYSMSFQLDS